MRITATFILFCLSSFSQGLLLYPDQLASSLKDPGLVLLHVGAQKDYDSGHIPGARLVTLADLSITGEKGLRMEMPPVDALRASLLKLGVSDTSRVVIYTGNDSIQSATRVFFTFDYLSLKAALLDGGLSLWKSKGLPISTEAASFSAANRLTVKQRPELIVDAAYTSAHLNDSGISIIDARLPEFYNGTNAGGMARAGHIPNASNLPYASFVDENKKVLPVDSLKQKLGTKPVVTYCHLGMQATVVYFASRLAGVDARLYDGSFEDWSSRTELAVSTEVKDTVKDTKKYHVIFEMSAGEQPRLEAVIRNIDNLKIALGPENVVVELVLHGMAILSYTKDKAGPIAADWERLAKSGVGLLACNNSLKMRNIPQDALLPYVKIVDSAVAELVRKQQAGWQYIRNAN